MVAKGQAGLGLQVRMGLTFVHAGSACEADFLFPSGGRGRGPRKRKRGAAVATPGAVFNFEPVRQGHKHASITWAVYSVCFGFVCVL